MQSRSKSLWRRCRVLPVGERLDSGLNVERAKEHVLKNNRFVVQTAQELLGKFESQVAQEVADLERLRAKARVTATGSPERMLEQHIRVCCSLTRSRSIEEGTGRVFRKHQPTTIVRHVHAGDPRVSFESDTLSSMRQSEGASTCLPQSPIACCEEENLIVRAQRCPPRRGKPRSRAFKRKDGT